MKIIKSLSYIILIVILSITTLSAQNYTIIHVKGSMKLSDGTILKRGDKLDESSRVIFESDESAAAAISSNRGRFVIKKGEDKSQSADSFYLLKSVLTPVKGRMSTRSGELNNIIALQNYFSEAPLVFLTEKDYISVNQVAFPQDYQNFFFLTYTYKGETINKKLISDKQTMLWDKTEIYKVDGEKILSEETSEEALYYLGKGKMPVLISKLEFVFLSEQEVNNLLSDIKNDGNLSLKQKVDASAEIVEELYGKAQKKTIEDLLKK